MGTKQSREEVSKWSRPGAHVESRQILPMKLICDKLNVYHPRQTEEGRENTHNPPFYLAEEVSHTLRLRPVLTPLLRTTSLKTWGHETASACALKTENALKTKERSSINSCQEV